MEKVKIINKKTGIVKEVKKALASDYIGTGNFEMYNEKPKTIFKKEEKPKYTFVAEEEK